MFNRNAQGMACLLEPEIIHPNTMSVDMAYSDEAPWLCQFLASDGIYVYSTTRPGDQTREQVDFWAALCCMYAGLHSVIVRRVRMFN